MRRITLKYAKPGMVVDYPVYDNFGKRLVKKHTQLYQEHINLMVKNGVRDLFIYDSRVADVVVMPLFSPQTEGSVADIYRKLLIHHSTNQQLDDEYLSQIHIVTQKLISDMSLNVIGEINVLCRISLTDYAYLQPVKTALLCLALGDKLGMSKDDLVILGMAAFLKDIALAADRYNGDGTQAGEDAQQDEKDHPNAGYQLLMKHEMTSGKIAEAVLQHHEYWNGSGYPQGLKNKEMSYHARVISIADSFIHLLSEKPGEETYMSHEAIEYLMAFSGDQFDPELIEFFVRQIPSYPSGLLVKLNTGEIGIISDPKLGFIARPIVRICTTPEMSLIEDPYDIDLSKSNNQRTLITNILEYD